jgi:hypothetical protein
VKKEQKERKTARKIEKRMRWIVAKEPRSVAIDGRIGFDRPSA